MMPIKNIFIISFLLFGTFVTTNAQIRQIMIDRGRESTNRFIKIENNNLYLNHFSGLLYKDISSVLSNNDWQSSHFSGFPIDNYFVYENRALAVSICRNIPLLIKTEDNGTTYKFYSPEQFESSGIYLLLQNPVNKNEIMAFLFNGNICYSYDFGDTWELRSENYFDIINGKYHPTDPNIIIVGITGPEEAIYYSTFMISFDNGFSWEIIDMNFDGAAGIAYHYSNPDIIVVNGWKVMKSVDKGKSWEIVYRNGGAKPEYTINYIEFDKRGSNRLYGTKWDTSKYQTQNQLYYSDNFGATWVELCEISLEEDDYVIDFVQHDNKIYTYSKNYKVHQIDLELLESSVEEVAIDNGKVSVSVVGNSLQINSKTPISMVEIYNISGVKLHSSEMLEGAVVDISALTKGTYVARLYASNGNSVSIKFNK